MLKPQDIVILLKIIAIKIGKHLEAEKMLQQSALAMRLCMSASEVNAAFKRLKIAGLIAYYPVRYLGTNDAKPDEKLMPVLPACEECLIHGVKYFFPAELGTESPGIATSYGAPLFKGKVVVAGSAIPVWPYAEGKQRGLALKPLYRSVPKSLTEYPDKDFYELLVLVDVLRSGRVREKNIAKKIIQHKIKSVV